jgi:hypothetical protein
VTALSDAIAQLRIDLADQDAGAYRWTDAQLTEHINHALAELSAEIPFQAKNTLTTTAGSRDLSIGALNPRVAILAVEYPTNQYPPIYVPFSVFAYTLTMLIDSPPAGVENAYVYWLTHHTLATTTTLDASQLQLLLIGAAGYAAAQLASYAAERVSVGGPDTDRDYASMSNRYLRDFRSALKKKGERGKLHIRRMYMPAEPAATQDTDPGP